jgi:hypothetical protein
MTGHVHVIAAVILVCGMTATTGCTKTYRNKSARYEIGAPPVGERIVQPDVYQVKWVAAGSLQVLPHTDHYLNAGDTVGFETTPDGTLIAYAGVHRHELPPLPPDARSLVWHSQRTKSTAFGRTMSAALPALAEGLAEVGPDIAVAAIPHHADCTNANGYGNSGAICERNQKVKSKLAKKYGCCD